VRRKTWWLFQRSSWVHRRRVPYYDELASSDCAWPDSKRTVDESYEVKWHRQASSSVKCKNIVKLKARCTLKCSSFKSQTWWDVLASYDKDFFFNRTYQENVSSEVIKVLLRERSSYLLPWNSKHAENTDFWVGASHQRRLKSSFGRNSRNSLEHSRRMCFNRFWEHERGVYA